MKKVILTLVVLFNVFNGIAQSFRLVGEKAPEINLEAIYNKSDNKIPTLQSLKGKVVVLDFWATWCNPCVEAFPENNKLSNKYKDKGVQYIAITDDKKNKLENFLKKVGVDFWVGRDDNGEEFKNYKVTGRPQMFIINRKGNVVYEGNFVSDKLIEEVLSTDSVSTLNEYKETKKNNKDLVLVTSGGFAPGEDPLYNRVDKSLRRYIPREHRSKTYFDKYQFIIRPTLEKTITSRGKSWGWSNKYKNRDLVGITHYAGTLENTFKFLNNLSSHIWVKNKTKKLGGYDVVYLKKSPSIEAAFKEIQETLLESLSLNFKKVKTIELVNKLTLKKKNENVITASQIENGTKHAYKAVTKYISRLEIITNEYFIADKSLKDKYIYNRELGDIDKANAKDIIAFLKTRNIEVKKEKEVIEIFEITSK